VNPSSASYGGAAALECTHAEQTPLYGGLLTRCRACSLVRTTTDPRFDYATSYFVTDDEKGYDFDSLFARTLDAARFGAELDRLAAEGLRGTLLDVGCATGTFLTLARQRGWAVCGVEVAEFARKTAAERSGAPVVASLDEIRPEQRFDVVTLHHVLEHIHEPLPFLRDVVRPHVGRRLVIEVPNFASLAARADGPRWRDLRPEQHVTHFEPETLRRLVAAAGYHVHRVGTLWEPLWSLRSAVELLRLLPYAVLRPSHDSATPAAPLGLLDVKHYAPPQGARRVLVETSRRACAPLVRAIERGCLAERLFVEATPGVAVGRAARRVEPAMRDAATALAAEPELAAGLASSGTRP
jgi:SAM-dependent methyltransferase